MMLSILAALVLLATSATEAAPSPAPAGAYLGQKPPGHEAELFAAGIVSTEAIENAPTFSPDGKELFFTRAGTDFKFKIMMTRQVEGGWTEPEVAPFSGEHNEGSPLFSPDGDRLYYESERAPEGGSKGGGARYLWVVERAPGGWSEPRCIGRPEGHVDGFWNPSPSSDGFVYFDAPHGEGGKDDLFRSRLELSAGPEKGSFTEIESLGKANSPEAVDAEPTLAPDGSYLIFYSAGRPDQMGEGLLGDLYVTFLRADGSWTEARNLGPSVNSTAEENWPEITPDGKYLFFSSNRDSASGFPSIYWVSTEVIEALR